MYIFNNEYLIYCPYLLSTIHSYVYLYNCASSYLPLYVLTEYYLITKTVDYKFFSVVISIATILVHEESKSVCISRQDVVKLSSLLGLLHAGFWLSLSGLTAP